MKWFSDAVLNLVAFPVAASSGLGLTLMITHYLGLQDAGYFAVLMVALSIATQLVSVGMPSYLLRVGAIRDTDSCLRIMFYPLVSVSLASMVALLVLVGAITWIKIGFPHLPVNIADILLVACAVPFFSINKLFSAFFSGSGRHKCVALVHILRGFFLLLFGYILIQIDTTIILNFLLTEGAVCLVLNSIFLRGRPPKFIKFSTFKSVFYFGFFRTFSGLAFELNLKMDLLVLTYFVNFDTVGIYAVFSQLAEGIYRMICVIRNVLNKKLKSLIWSKKMSNLRIELLKIISFVFFVCICVTGLVGSVYPTILGFFLVAHEFEQGAIIFWILALGFTFFSPLIVLENILIYIKKSHVLANARAFTVVLNVGLNFMLINIFGVSGAAMATVVCSGFVGVMLLFYSLGDRGVLRASKK